MDYFVYGVALLLLASVVLFIKVVLFDRRPQKTGLLFALLAIPLFMTYYADRWPFGVLPMRQLISTLDNLEGANSAFRSDIAPAYIVAGVLLVQMTVFQRVAVRQRLQRVHDPIANFFASAVLATLVGGILVSTFAWGWIGAVSVGVVYALVYLGALALLASVVEIFVELSKLISVWLRRQVFSVATWITRVASFLSSLSGRLGLTSLADRIRAATGHQESIFEEEQELQDRELFEAFIRDRAHQRRMAGKPERDQDQDLPKDAEVAADSV